jgi:hypothetical protein
MRENTRCNRNAHIPSCTSREKQGNRHSQYSSSKRHHLYWRALPPSSPFPVSQISTPPHSFAVCVSQSLRCQACLQSGKSPTTMPGTTSPLKACYSYSDPCSTSKTPSTGRTNPEQQRRCRKSSLIWPARIAPTLFRKRPRTVHVGICSGSGGAHVKRKDRMKLSLSPKLMVFLVSCPAEC